MQWGDDISSFTEVFRRPRMQNFNEKRTSENARDSLNAKWAFSQKGDFWPTLSDDKMSKVSFGPLWGMKNDHFLKKA